VIGVSSSGRRFAPLAKYLAVGKSGHEQERVAWSEGRNLPTDDPRLAAQIMQATAWQNPRVKEPVYHVAVSFDPKDGERVTPELMRQVADRLLKDLKLDEHQVMIVAHRDREHQHMHLMINRVHPETGLAWDRWRDQVTVQRSLREQERELGLTEVRGRLYQLPGQDAPERPTVTSGELRQLARGEELFAERVRERLADLRDATSWRELHARLAEHGLRVERKGQGLVVTDGEREVKASRVARDVSFKQLEARLGPYVPGKQVPSRAEERVVGQVLERANDRAGAGAVDRAAKQVRTADRATQLRDEAHTADQVAAAARAKLERLEWWEQRTRVLAQEFDRALGRAYIDPAAARQQFAELEASNGRTVAIQTLAERPDTFGSFALGDERGRWGFKSRTDTAAREHVPGAVAAARELGDASDRLSSLVRSVSDSPAIDAEAYVRAVTQTRERAAQAEGRAERARAARGLLPDDATIRRQLGKTVRALAPAEVQQLYAVLTSPQRALAQAATRAVRDLVRGHEGPAFL
jgi:hypothetical protein